MNAPSLSFCPKPSLMPGLGALRAHLGPQRLVPPVNVDQRQHRKQAVGVLCQAPIAHLGKAPNLLEREKRVLHLGARLALGGVDLFVPLAQRRVAVGAFVGEVPGFGRMRFENVLLARIGTVTVQTRLLAVQQMAQLLAIVYVGPSHAGAVDQGAGAVHADVGLHTEVPLAALFSLVHLRISRFVLVLGGAGRGNDGGVHDGAPAQAQAIGLQQLAYLGEDGFAQIVALQQVAKVQQCGGVGHALMAQVNAAEGAKAVGVVQRVFAGHVRQVKPVGNTVHAQHGGQRTRGSAVARFGVVGLDQLYERAPRYQALHAGKKGRFAGGLAKGFKARCGQCGLSHRLHGVALKINQLSHAMSVPFGRQTCSVFP